MTCGFMRQIIGKVDTCQDGQSFAYDPFDFDPDPDPGSALEKEKSGSKSGN